MEKRNINILGFGLLAMAAGMQGVAIVVQAAMIMIAPRFSVSAYGTMTMQLVAYIAAVALLYVVVRRLPTHTAPGQKLSAGGFVAAVVISMGATYILNYIGGMINYLLNLAVFERDVINNPVDGIIANLSLWQIFLLVCVMAPIFEELLFRKILLDRLRPFGDKAAILYSAFAFGLFHMNLTQMLYASAIGLVLGYVVCRTGNWWTGVLLHAVINFMGSVLPTFIGDYVGGELGDILIYAILGAWVLFGLIALIVVRKKIRPAPAPYSFSRPINFGLMAGNAGTALYIVACCIMMVVTFLMTGLLY